MSWLTCALAFVANVAAVADTMHYGNPTFYLSSYAHFKTRFIAADGRVVDDHNGGVSHSESQGYGMLAAALAGDRTTFDQIWSWTRSTLMVRGDDLMAWRWEPNATPHVKDMNNASDGDLIVAWALLEASDRWSGAYRQDARKIGRAIERKLLFQTWAGLTIRPGIEHFGEGDQSDGPVINLSYWVFPALARLEADDPTGPWSALIKSGLELIDVSRFGPLKLPSDWISVRSRPAPAAMKPARFSYDAIRVPLYLAWAFPTEKARLAIFTRAIAGGTFQVVELGEGKLIEPFGGEGFVRLAHVLVCATATAGQRPPGQAASNDSYYPSVIELFSIYVLQEKIKC